MKHDFSILVLQDFFLSLRDKEKEMITRIRTSDNETQAATYKKILKEVQDKQINIINAITILKEYDESN